MKKYKYLLCILSFLTLLSLILMNRYETLNAFNNNYVLEINDSTTESEEVPIIKENEVEKLQKEYNNEDVVGTLEILNTDYKVPVVQGSDNNYYLRRLPNKEYSIMGSIFLDYRVNINTSKKLLIYGHNDKKIEMPFKILENYYDKSYLDSHKYVVITSKERVRTYEIFSVFVEPTDFSYMKVNFKNSSYIEHLNLLKNKSMFNLDIDLDENTNILLLQTCSTHKNYLKYKKKYLILAFKEINNKGIDE